MEIDVRRSTGSADWIGPGKIVRPPSRSAMSGFRRILLKNSNFGLDHNLEDRWQPRRKFILDSAEQPALLRGILLGGLAVTTTGVDYTMRADAGFPPSLNFRVFQQYPSICDVQSPTTNVGTRGTDRVTSIQRTSAIRARSSKAAGLYPANVGRFGRRRFGSDWPVREAGAE